MPRSDRIGFTIVELLVGLAILAVLIGLLVPAVQKVRESAVRTRSAHNLRQLCLATHHFAGVHDSYLPVNYGNRNSIDGFLGVCHSLLPLLENGSAYTALLNNPNRVGGRLKIEVFVSPADPSFGVHPGNFTEVSSYPANGQVFRDRPSLTQTFADGTTNTILFAEHYAGCGPTVYLYGLPRLVFHPNVRPATFADPGSFASDGMVPGDVLPVTTGSPPVTTAGTPGVTFQVRPAVHADLPGPPGTPVCDGRLAQTPHLGGMLVAMADGSVRTIRPGVAEAVYWAAVTPAGGEVASLD